MSRHREQGDCHECDTPAYAKNLCENHYRKARRVALRKTVAGTTWVYQLYAIDDTLLYVGISWNIDNRFRWHEKRSWWWPRVDRWTTERFPTRTLAAQRERELIRSEFPVYNEKDTECFACGRDGRLVLNRCPTCYEYWRRTGKDRSEDVRITVNGKILERELEAVRIFDLIRAYA